MGTKKSLASELEMARMMAAGTRNCAEAMSRFIDPKERADEIEALADDVAKGDAEQEAMKAALLKKTQAVNEMRVKLHALVAETKKLAKMSVAKEDYPSFGINDKR